MQSRNQFSCFIIGEGTLPIQCAEILLHRGHEIHGIVASDASFIQWAQGKNIPHHAPMDDLLAFFCQPFDYLFSIVNEHLLPTEILELPRKCAINYHDAPLPRYAGSHATSWALMDRETSHGVTWHVMSKLIDSGDILKQWPVDIEAGDTALTLNAKCYEAAIASFTELIDDLSRGAASGEKQNLDARTFFPLYKRPPVGGVFSWNRCAYDTDAFVRALDFGPYPNPLGLPKFAIERDFIIVCKTEVLDSVSETAPGTVMGIDSDSLQVSTTSRVIAARKFLTIDGQSLSISDLVARFGLHEGFRFKDIDPESARRITELNASICRHEAFWVERLSTLQPIGLPYAARNESPPQSARYASVPVPIPKEVTSYLVDCQTAWNLSDFLLAAFAVYLARIGDVCSFDIRYRDARMRRDLAGLERFFAPYVPLRLEVNNAHGFGAAFRAVREQVELTKQHKTYARDVVTRYPALRSMIELQRERTLPVTVERVARLENYEAAPGSGFTLVIPEDGAECRWVYDTGVLDTDSVTRMLSQFLILLQGIIASPEQRLSDLPILTEAERHQLLVEWNDTEREFSKDKCIHELFEAQVEKTPDAVALVFEDQQLTYRELNNRANQLAHYLQKLGVGPEVLVGLCLERSLEMIVGVLGILKAGGAYVPMDPAYPKGRLDFMLADTQARVLLTTEKLSRALPTTAELVVTDAKIRNARRVCLDKDWQEIARESEERPECNVSGGNLAYVVYTSGTTGKSKGAMITHSSLVNVYLAWEEAYQLQSTAPVYLQMANIAFDVFSADWVRALCSGGKLVLCPTDFLLDAPQLYALMRREEVDCADFVPLVMRNLLNYLEDTGQTLNFMRLLVVGSEVWYTEEYQKIQSLCDPNTRVMNSYGVTEATIDSSYFCGIVSTLSANRSVPIGRPFANTQLYIVDRHLQPAPVGVPGELCISGAGLARGYLNRAELTAEKFLANPFTAEPEARLYKTGDRARWRSDGNIEFLGRIDDQVKIRGFRIELGEIEAVLNQHRAVRECAVVAREDIPGDRQLVAYVVTHQAAAPTVQELRSLMKEKLPEYMVPSAFVYLRDLPITPNGKLDRKALPAPDSSRRDLENTFVAPRTQVEELLAQVWAEVLNVDKIGIHDNFFDLGGHSLLAMRIVSRIRDIFHREIPLRSLFEAPTIAELVVRFEKDDSRVPGPKDLCISAIDRDRELPLSFAQQRLWFLDQIEPNSAVYNIPVMRRLKGQLDLAALERSVNEMVRRHEALRTIFITSQGQPTQQIMPSLTVSVPVVDLSDIPESEREQAGLRYSSAECQRPFDLAQGPLLRASVIRMGPEDQILVITLHHIVSDGWSVEVMFRELSAHYAAFSQGQASCVEKLPIQYADFAQWQRQWLQGDVLEKQLSYWKTQLQDITVLELPTDRPRPPVQSYHGASQSIALSEKLTQQLKKLSRQEGVTLFMTLLAALQTLLQRYTGQDDIAVGSPIAGRTRSEIENLIGFFVNTLVLRTDLSGEPTFHQLLCRVRETTLAAYAHQDLPFEKLVEELRPERSLSRNPLFQVMLNLEHAPAEGLRLGDLVVTPVETKRQSAKFDLNLAVRETQRRLRLELNYSTELFADATIGRMLGHFHALLQGIGANSDQRISDLPLLTEEEKHQLLVEWNDTERNYPRGKCIHELFEEQVERSPDATAVIFENQQLTYRELNRKANQLAHYLRNLGVGPEVLVGLFLERSLEMIVGILGILKTGGAYVPLDPAYPKERLAFMLENSRAALLVTQQHLQSTLPDHKVKMILLDADCNSISDRSEANPENHTLPTNLAYLIYTSGSSGQPKGILISHANLSNYVHAMRDSLAVTKNDVYLHTATISFSSSVRQLMVPLAHGATVVISSVEQIHDPLVLFEMIKRENVTIIDIVPSYWRSCIHALTSLDVETGKSLLDNRLRLILTASEPLLPDLPKKWCMFESSHPSQLINMFGQTETTGIVTVYPYRPYDLPGDRVVNIGRPIANTQIFLLDKQQRPVPIGVVGEIYVGGADLGRGYLNQPELTAEKFVPNPFGEAGTRLYRTGDMGAYMPDGNIAFVGRMDQQVKIRGFRVELGEIETALRQHPSVRETVVLAREDLPGYRRLVAYVVSHQASVPTASELRSFLNAKIPDYMVPSGFFLLDALPLSPNGKVDRQALPALDRPELKDGFVAPRTPDEILMVSIWTEVLNLKQIGIHDNFFGLGGHSLLATQVISRVRKVFAVDLPLRELFEAPTVAGMAAAVLRKQCNWTDQQNLADLLSDLESLPSEEVQRILPKN